eukprot:gene2466-2806_t
MKGTDTEPGIIPLAIAQIFAYIDRCPDREFILRVSYVEIYKEILNDLLNINKTRLEIHEDPIRGVYVTGLKEEIVTSPESIMALMKKGEEANVLSAIVTLVDLAGSERVKDTGAEGNRLQEGMHINKSLSTLSNVISKLSEAGGGGTQQHIPFRDSKLTRILQSSLGGNSKTAIIATITPASMHVEESMSTLKFAKRAQCIKTDYHINVEVLTDAQRWQRSEQENQELRANLAAKEKLIADLTLAKRPLDLLKSAGEFVPLERDSKKTRRDTMPAQMTGELTAPLTPLPALPITYTRTLEIEADNDMLAEEIDRLAEELDMYKRALEEREVEILEKEEEAITAREESELCQLETIEYRAILDNLESENIMLAERVNRMDKLEEEVHLMRAERVQQDELDQTQRDAIYMLESEVLTVNERVDQVCEENRRCLKQLEHVYKVAQEVENSGRDKYSSITRHLAKVGQSHAELQLVNGQLAAENKSMREMSTKILGAASEYREMVHQVTADNIYCKEHITTLAAKNDQLFADHQTISKQVDHVAKVNQELMTINSEITQSNDHLSSELDKEKAETRALQQSIEQITQTRQAKDEEWQNKCQSLETDIQLANESCQTYKNLYVESSIKIQSLQDGGDSLTTKISQLAADIANKDAIIRAKQEEIDTMMAVIQKQEETAKCRDSDLHTMAAMIKSINQSVKDKDVEMAKEIATREETIKSMDEEIRARVKEVDMRAKELNGMQEELDKKTFKVQEVEKRREKEVKEISEQLVAAEAARDEALAKLKKTARTAVAKTPQVDREKEELRKDREKTLQKMTALESKLKQVTMEKATVATEKATLERESKERKKVQTDLEKELEKLRQTSRTSGDRAKELADRNKSLEATVKSTEKIRAHAAEQDAEVARVKDEMQKRLEEVANIQTKWTTDVAAKSEVIARLENDVDSARYLTSKVEIELETAKKTVARLEQELEVASGESGSIKSLMAERDATIGQMEGQLESKDMAMAVLQSESDSKTQTIASIEMELSKTRLTIVELEQQLAAKTKDLETNLAENNQYCEQLGEMGFTIEEKKAELEAIKIEMATVKSQSDLAIINVKKEAEQSLDQVKSQLVAAKNDADLMLAKQKSEAEQSLDQVKSQLAASKKESDLVLAKQKMDADLMLSNQKNEAEQTLAKQKSESEQSLDAIRKEIQVAKIETDSAMTKAKKEIEEAKMEIEVTKNERDMVKSEATKRIASLSGEMDVHRLAMVDKDKQLEAACLEVQNAKQLANKEMLEKQRIGKELNELVMMKMSADDKIKQLEKVVGELEKEILHMKDSLDTMAKTLEENEARHALEIEEMDDKHMAKMEDLIAQRDEANRVNLLRHRDSLAQSLSSSSAAPPIIPTIRHNLIPPHNPEATALGLRSILKRPATTAVAPTTTTLPLGKGITSIKSTDPNFQKKILPGRTVTNKKIQVNFDTTGESSEELSIDKENIKVLSNCK